MGNRPDAVTPVIRGSGPRLDHAYAALRDLGTRPGMDDDLRRHVRITNVAAVVLFLLLSPYYFVFRWLGQPLPAAFVPALGACYGLALLANARGFHSASRLLLLSSINVAIFAYSAFLGERLGIIYAWYFCLIAPFMLFHIRERGKIALCVVQPIMAWSLLHLVPGLGDVSAFSPQATRTFYLCITSTSAVMVVLSALLIYVLQQKASTDLRRAREAAEASDRAKSEFLATISHEIRTPMNGILASAQLLALHAFPPTQRDFLRMLADSGNRLLAILNDILDFSKIESGKLELEKVRLDLGGLLEEVVSLCRAEAEAKGLCLRLERDPGIPAALLGDPVRLRQAALNLLANAVKFTARGGVTVRLRRLDGAGGRVRVAVSVQDTGIGIPEAQRAKLFKPFSQLDSTSTREYGGTGLGLVIVHRLSRLMGGDLRCQSRYGEGSTFTFEAVLDEGERASTDLPFRPLAA